MSSARDRIAASRPDANHQPNEVRKNNQPARPAHLSPFCSVIGIIAIPGTMTGAILGGADVAQAARLQMIIMFMISASSVLSCIIVTLLTLYVCVDSEHRIRGDRIYARPHSFRRASSNAVQAILGSVRCAWVILTGSVKHLFLRGVVVSNGNDGHGIDSRSERAPLLP